MRISDWSSDVCSSDLPWSLTLAACRALPVDAKIRLREDRFSPDRRRVAPLRAKIRRRLSAILGLRSTWAPARRKYAPRRSPSAAQAKDSRTEEHTSDLQSLMRTSYADFCLKEKKIATSADIHRH